jgi:hypothetical protein
MFAFPRSVLFGILPGTRVQEREKSLSEADGGERRYTGEEKQSLSNSRRAFCPHALSSPSMLIQSESK